MTSGAPAQVATPPGRLSARERARQSAYGGALADKSIQEKFINSGAELVPDALQTSKGFTDYIKQEYENSREAAKLAGLKPE